MLRLEAELPEGFFLGIQCSAPRTVIFLLRAAATRKREIGGEMGSYSNAPLVAELPGGLLFWDPMQRTASGDFSFTRRCCAQARTVARKRNTPTHRGGALHWQEL